jgi:hypothetical protein
MDYLCYIRESDKPHCHSRESDGNGAFFAQEGNEDSSRELSVFNLEQLY